MISLLLLSVISIDYCKQLMYIIMYTVIHGNNNFIMLFLITVSMDNCDCNPQQQSGNDYYYY